jgi:SAM-dependent methyltransferase
MIQLLREILRRESFHPSTLFGLLLNPFYFSRKALDEAVKKWAPEITGRILDVGCGTKPYRNYFQVEHYIGLEVDQGRLRPDVEFTYDGGKFPFGDAAFDSVVSFQVLEHVRDPVFFVSEIRRVVKPGGRVLITVPFVWEEHEIPNDRMRFTSYGLRELLERSGFDVMNQEKLNTGFLAVAQILTGMITVPAMRLPRLTRWAIQLFIVAPIHLFAIATSRVLRSNDQFYLDNLVLAESLRYYKD